MATLLQFPINRFQLLIRRCITLLNGREGERQIPKQRWGSDSEATRGVTACRQRRVFVSNCVCVYKHFWGPRSLSLPHTLSYHANPCVSLSFVLSFALAHLYCAPLVPHNFCLLVFSASFCSRCRCRRTTSACFICSISCVLHTRTRTHTHTCTAAYFWPKPAGKRSDNRKHNSN